MTRFRLHPRIIPALIFALLLNPSSVAAAWQRENEENFYSHAQGESIIVEFWRQSRSPAAPQTLAKRKVIPKIKARVHTSKKRKILGNKTAKPAQETKAESPLSQLASQYAREKLQISASRISSNPGRGWILAGKPIWVWTKDARRELQTKILGETVHLQLQAQSFHFDFGDGTTLKTTSPGAAYPEGKITHVYRQAGHYPLVLTTHWVGSARAKSKTVPLEVDTVSPAQMLKVWGQNPYGRLRFKF